MDCSQSLLTGAARWVKDPCEAGEWELGGVGGKGAVVTLGQLLLSLSAAY